MYHFRVLLLTHRNAATPRVSTFEDVPHGFTNDCASDCASTTCSVVDRTSRTVFGEVLCTCAVGAIYIALHAAWHGMAY